jgi:DNA-directed RNA polymerase specialized sigma24 family protein
MVVRRDSDVAAFSEFVAVRSGSLLRTACLVIGDYHLAQDLVQESLTKILTVFPARSTLLDSANAPARPS